MAAAAACSKTLPQPWISILASVRFVAPTQVEAAPLPQLQLPNRPLTLAEMPADTLIFASDARLRLNSVWQPASATGEIPERTAEDTATIAYNEPQTLATIVIVRLEGMSFVDWRDSLISDMGSALLTSNAPVNAEVYIRSGAHH